VITTLSEELDRLVRFDPGRLLVVPGAITSPEELFGPDQLAALLEKPELVRAAGVYADFELVGVPSQYTAEFIAQQRARGASVVYRGLQRMKGPLRDLCTGLVEEGCPSAHVVAFQSPAHVPACKLHFDPYPVLVVQISGTKAWTVYEQHPDLEDLGVDTSPKARGGVLTAIEEAYYAGQTPYAQFTLSEGGAALVPPDLPHRALGETESFHVSVCRMGQAITAEWANADHGLSLVE
jgi:ribosomal protein L16 Arg81 hydroxylase